MITSIQCYNTNFNGLKNLKSQKVLRQIVKIENQTPEGLSKASRNELDEKTKKYLLYGGSALLGTTIIPSVTTTSINMESDVVHGSTAFAAALVCLGVVKFLDS